MRQIVHHDRSLLRYSILGLLLVIGGWGLIYVLTGEVRRSVEIPDYRVDFVEPQSPVFFDVPRFFEIHRGDGQRAKFLIDIDASRCLGLRVRDEGDRIYFQCAGESLDESSYVDRVALTVFSGWYQQSEAIANLDFAPPAAETSE